MYAVGLLVFVGAKIFIELSNRLNSLCTEYCPQYQTQQRLTFLTDLNYSTVYLLRLFGQEFGCLYDVVVFQRPAMMSVEKGYFYTDASCLVTEYCKHGSVLVGTHTEYQ